MSYRSRYNYEIEAELSRKIAIDRELEYSRAIEIQRNAELAEIQYKQAREYEKLREDQQFREYQIKKNIELQEAEAGLIRQRAYREDKQREYEIFKEAENRSRLQREEELAIQKKILEDENRRKAQALAASRRIELEKQINLQSQIERQNQLVLQQQKEQQKLEKQLRDIDVQIGTIYDQRDERKRLQLLQFEQLDQKIFKLRQQIRGSKVRQQSLEQQLLHLSKLIV